MKRSNDTKVPAQAWTLRAKTIRRLVLSAVAMALVLPLLAQHLRAEDMPPPDAAAAANLECAGEPLSGSGPGFSSSRDASEGAARAAWLEKAKAVYPQASWETAKDAAVACAVQGLYSKCFAQGIPCRPKPEDTQAGAAPDEAPAPKPE